MAHPMDSLLAAVAVPSNVGSSPDPKVLLTRKHTGTGLNPDVTPKGLQYKVWWDAGQHQTQGSHQQEDLSPAPAAVPPPSTPFLHHTLYTAWGGNVVKSSLSMKRKWQPKGPWSLQMPFPGRLEATAPCHHPVPGCPRPHFTGGAPRGSLSSLQLCTPGISSWWSPVCPQALSG